jgi:hypothetical protein
MAARKTQPREYPVSVEHEGKTYTGSYSVAKGVVTVWYDLRSNTTQVGGSRADSVARMLLFELVRKSGDDLV